MSAQPSPPKAAERQHSAYRGFVAGVFSGVGKLTVGHPFDTIKVRLQTSSTTHFTGPLDCLRQTLQREGLRGLYKGASPPLVGWMFMDSLMLGSLSNYRSLIKTHFYPNHERLPLPAQGASGMLAGWTVSLIAAPVEHVKARLQVQYNARGNREGVKYRGPIDCIKKLYGAHGLRGIYHGLCATLLFRTFFFFWWGSYDLFSRYLATHTSLSTPAINFWAGGLSAQMFWITSYPSDAVKQRIMTDDLDCRRFRNWREAAKGVYREAGWRGYWRFVDCTIFPCDVLVRYAG
ncbi:mitochondrial carrier [Morchella conica CCBAS932]|uniref:Mitochondrial carrier n=1 Tax=Morchella conica CCBAS932 TaxID=1392247 RepID=A0A3N4KNP7_9PEZI|nr:mitochondrial carrier [Morchella conica CCBAS932]